ncbi:MAG: TIR domain-containing protein, partial [Chloroflexota bacterium]
MSDIDIFVSHATVDDTIVSKIHDLLEAEGLNVWVDHEDGIEAGDYWAQEIQNAANACEAGLFVMSSRSVDSVYCEAEYQRILARGVILYIVLIEPLPLERIPLRLGTIQYIDLTQDFDAGMTQLINVIKSKRQAPLTATATKQRIKISGTFPRSYLDLPLIGRDDEFEQVQSLLEENNRMVSILGLGGLGKTRLAVDIATQAQFRDGVIWYTISPTTDIHRLTTQIRDHLRLDDTYADNAVWEQLNTRQCLIVLDNAEDCRQPATYANRINSVDLTNGTRFLMTSRYQWREVRTKPINLRFLDEKSALAVFDAMLDREPPAFDVASYKEQLVQSARFHPRLIEYSVGWLNYYPPEFVLKILQSLEGEDAEDMLTDIVRKTIDQMRQQENGEDAITALRRLAVCRDGFTFEASQALIDNPKLLATLKQWNLVDLDMGRYALDPLVIKVADIDE